MSERIDYVYWIRGAEHASLAELSIASVRKVDPGAHVHVYSDDVANTPHIDGTLRHDLPAGRPAMVANLDAQLLHLTTALYGTPVLFLDTDTLLRRAFPFDASTDLYVTWRDHVGVSNGEKVAGIAALMPYNYGVLGTRVGTRSIEAFAWLRARILNMSRRYQDWYGNQLALADLVGAPPATGEATLVRSLRWTLTDPGTPLAVRQLPCDIWNYSPEAEGEDVSGKAVIHLKGSRKGLMQHYAEAA